jgi:hypothetical protein
MESLLYSLSNAGWERLLGLALCGGGEKCACQNGERGVEQDERSAPAEWDMTHATPDLGACASPLR